MPIRFIPPGTQLHNLELQPARRPGRSRRGARRSCSARKQYRAGQLPSGEVRKFGLDCMATIGQVGNLDHENVTYGKAGRTRWHGRRPTVRGVAMNPVDHPHGGGEGASKAIIRRHRGAFPRWAPRRAGTVGRTSRLFNGASRKQWCFDWLRAQKNVSLARRALREKL